MPDSTAAWLRSPKKPLTVDSAPYTRPSDNEVVIRNHAVAVNPVDWIFVQMSMVASWIKYPWVLGSDVAGEMVEIGSAVIEHKVGDRVLGHANGFDKKRNRAAEGAFQTFSIVEAHMASSIPDDMAYESAAVIPLGVSTAACGLYQKDQLGLNHPTVPHAKLTGKTLLVWGGATSVGCNAIQLAVASGYEVISTASPKNFDLVKRLGASQVFDYNSKTVVEDLINAFKGKTTAGALTMGSGAAQACMDILHKCKGDKFISMASYPTPQPLPETFVIPQMAYGFISFSISNFVKSKLRGIPTNFIFGSTLAHNEVGKAIYVDFLPKALAQGTFVPAPDPQVVGTGLEHMQTALEIQKKGVSAKKVVVLL